MTPHGTRRGADYHGCKCEPCAEARRAYARDLYKHSDEYREAHKARNQAYYHKRKEDDRAIDAIRAKVKAEREAQGLAVASI